MANNRSKTAFENYNGDLTSREAGKIGGNIVKKVFEAYTGNTYQLEKK